MKYSIKIHFLILIMLSVFILSLASMKIFYPLWGAIQQQQQKQQVLKAQLMAVPKPEFKKPAPVMQKDDVLSVIMASALKNQIMVHHLLLVKNHVALSATTDFPGLMAFLASLKCLFPHDISLQTISGSRIALKANFSENTEKNQVNSQKIFQAIVHKNPFFLLGEVMIFSDTIGVNI